jgi:hypothetical protein
MNDRRPLRHDRSTRLPTPAEWAARLKKFRELVERSAELDRLRERIRVIEARFNEQGASERPTPPRHRRRRERFPPIGVLA